MHRRLLRLLASAALVAVAVPASAGTSAELHTFHCLHGCPIGAAGNDDIVVRESTMRSPRPT